jgi:predicted CXXCH cytochrome family protein
VRSIDIAHDHTTGFVMLLPIVALAALAATPAPAIAPDAKKGKLAPVQGDVVSTHSPYGSGECRVCHERSDRADPGAAKRAANEICFDCHDEYYGTAARRMKHPAPKAACTSCHNPHNSTRKKLMRFKYTPRAGAR